MKRLILMVILLCFASYVFAQDASDDPTNAFASFGDCEGKIWAEATGDNTSVLNDVQLTTDGMVGQCSRVVQPALWTRTQASTVDAATDTLLAGTDADLQFYYKIVNLGYGGSYPYIYFRQGITDNGASVHPDGGATKVVYWSRSAVTGTGAETFTADGGWHLFDPVITDFNWTGQTADIVINFLCQDAPALSEFWMDEIYLKDPTPPVTSVDDWGLF
jgi:hypothetical protein